MVKSTLTKVAGLRNMSEFQFIYMLNHIEGIFGDKAVGD